VDTTLLLIQFSMQLPRVENCCFLIDALLKAMENRLILHSELAMQLFVHAKFVVEEAPSWTDVRTEVQKLCSNALDKLMKYRTRFLEHYQKYVEHEDKQKIKLLHEQNFHFQSIVSDFVTFYYKRDDLTRVQTLLSAARATNFCTAIERILIQLHVEIFRSQQIQTFEAFRLFNEVKYYMTLNARDFHDIDPKVGMVIIFNMLDLKPNFFQILFF
jgi:hypothetical protein